MRASNRRGYCFVGFNRQLSCLECGRRGERYDLVRRITNEIQVSLQLLESSDFGELHGVF